MPTIEYSLDDLNKLAGLDLSAEELDRHSLLCKAEFKSIDPADNTVKMELQDTNRPDLWCVEGIARQLKFKLNDDKPVYPWFDPGNIPVAGIFKIHPEMQHIRPFAAGIAVLDIDVTDDVLKAFIQTQEKLAENMGRHRAGVSIGIYDLNRITFPVHYRAVGLEGISFVPLGFDTRMTPAQIMKEHPKGQAYAHILKGHTHVPMLMDDADDILSFPPIINSRQSGEVKVGKRDLFIEATGTDFYNMILALNIFAVNLADRGGTVQAITIHSPYDTPLGRSFQLPFPLNQTGSVDMENVRNRLGYAFQVETAAKLLEDYGYSTQISGNSIDVVLPPWRKDLMHEVDVIEDIAISAGYDFFEPTMPDQYTVGKLAPITSFTDQVRDIMIGFGFEEIISNILCNRNEFADMMREPERRLVEIGNPMTEKYNALRDRVLPSMLRVERDSSSAQYPHRIFESGEVTLFDETSDTGTTTKHFLCVLIANEKAEISMMHAYLDTLLYRLDLTSKLKSVDIPAFIPGRSGQVYVNGVAVGWIGELHPEILDNFEIAKPTAAFELDLSELMTLVSFYRSEA